MWVNDRALYPSARRKNQHRHYGADAHRDVPPGPGNASLPFAQHNADYQQKRRPLRLGKSSPVRSRFVATQFLEPDTSYRVADDVRGEDSACEPTLQEHHGISDDE